MCEQFEKKNVIDIYNLIAPHFIQTRRKPWKKVQSFLNNITDNSIVGDIGCGSCQNKKDNIIYKGCDSSNKFVKLAQEKGLDVIEGNMIKIPFLTEQFDYVLNIAVLHHLSTDERRIKGLNELLRICKKNGLIIIMVWGIKDNSEQDKMIKWHLQKKFVKEHKIDLEETEQKLFVLNRYYHFFKEDELKDLLKKTDYDYEIIEEFTEKNNFGLIIKKL